MFKFVENAAKGINELTGLTGVKMKKYSPEIYFGLGVVSFIGTVVVASRATLKATDVIKQHQKNMLEIKESIKIAEENQNINELSEDKSVEVVYTEDDIKRDKFNTFCKTGVGMLKIYAPVSALGLLSLTCFFKAYRIPTERYTGVLAAFNGLSAAFQRYRERVIEKEGDKADRYYMYGAESGTQTRVEIDENGKKTKMKEMTENIESGNVPDIFNRVFDEHNDNWDRNINYSMMFLKAREHICNDILQSKGYIFMNEVLESLGFEGTPEGQVCGWVDNKEHTVHVDFGLSRIEDPSVRRFVNGQDNIVMLSFNHQGVVWDKI